MYEVKIPCPDHNEHEATLYTNGHQYAGIWECSVCETSDVCEHENFHFDVIENFPASAWDWIYSQKILICDLCDCVVEDADAFLVEQDCSL